MKLTHLLAVALLIVGLAGLSACTEKPSTSQPTASPTTAAPQSSEPAAEPPASAPASKVLAKIDDTEITSEQIEMVMFNQGVPPTLPPEQLQMIRQRMLDSMIKGALLEAYFKGLPADVEALAAWKKDVAEQVQMNTGMGLEDFMAQRGLTEEDLRAGFHRDDLQKNALSDEKIDALVKECPASYFDGTEVKASHILIACPLYASAEAQTAAREKLEGIAKDIAAGTISFEDAAKANSSCPSKAEGGDLGEFPFANMTPPFSQTAFATAVGQISPIVHTSFGYHIIKVTARTEGDGQVGEQAKGVAAGILMERLESDVIQKAAAAHPVTLNQ